MTSGREAARTPAIAAAAAFNPLGARGARRSNSRGGRRQTATAARGPPTTSSCECLLVATPRPFHIQLSAAGTLVRPARARRAGPCSTPFLSARSCPCLHACTATAVPSPHPSLPTFPPQPHSYKAYFRWNHYSFKLRSGTAHLPTETDACASVTAAFLQVLHTLHVAETSRVGDHRNILQVRPGTPRACNVM
jgi:hypothetical protein